MKSILAASTLTPFACLAALAGSCASARPAGPAVIAELAGRTAGAPQRCVPIRQTENLRIVNPQTVIYGSGRTIWVNTLASNCPGADRMDIFVVEPIGTQYCRGDRVKTVDPVSRIPGPACILGDFVPYSR
jgi:hypothetical protein